MLVLVQKLGSAGGKYSESGWTQSNFLVPVPEMPWNAPSTPIIHKLAIQATTSDASGSKARTGCWTAIGNETVSVDTTWYDLWCLAYMKTVPTLHSQRDGPFPVKPKRKNWRSANIILLVKTWNMLKLSLNFHRKVLLYNWTRHNQCPIFPGEWVLQSGGLKDLGNSFWVPTGQLTASLTSGALPYQRLHCNFSPNGYATPSLVEHRSAPVYPP